MPLRGDGLLPARLKELARLKIARLNTCKYSYGTPGVGTLHHLTTEFLKKQIGIQVSHVPYKGAAPAMVDLMGGHIPVAVTSATAALAQVKGGKLRIVGLTSRQRISSAPDISTIAEAVPGFEVTNDLFVLARAGTPPAAIAALSAALKTVFSQKELQDAYLTQGAIVAWSSPAGAVGAHRQGRRQVESGGEGSRHTRRMNQNLV